MATLSAPRRGGPRLSPSPHPKSTITVEEWDAKTPLHETEIRSIATAKAACEKPSRPFKVRLSLSLAVLILTPQLKYPAEEARSSRPSTRSIPSSRSQPLGAARALLPKQPVQTPQQFYDWFAFIDRSVAHSQEAHFREHLLGVSEYLEMCDRLVERIEEVDGEVASMFGGGGAWRRDGRVCRMRVNGC
ncbi:hypothetical protein EWM64_g6786 [Hericium alpestre]|uniref:Component of oligomeric Golgi complex 3 n=1 Tax=Hericium alpestre TaxID=135208 RepID=A0A4Y9ZQQ2_9AGAM|nr:hypothetical protein EWM64_g6786 [Hericium alpestre]